MSADIDFETVSFITSSRYRQEAVGALADSPATPGQLADAVDGDIAHVSRALQELHGKDVVELLVDEDVRKGRYYGLTETGERLAGQIDDLAYTGGQR